MRERRFHESVLAVSVQAKEEMSQLVGEDAPEGGSQDVLVHPRGLLPVPAAIDRPRDLLRPERDPAHFEMGVAQAVVVKVPAAPAYHHRLRPPKNGDQRWSRGRGLDGGEAPLKSDRTRLEQPVRFRERPLEGEGRDVRADVYRNLDGEGRAQQKREHGGMHS
jgi:hypothetical protein